VSAIAYISGFIDLKQEVERRSTAVGLAGKLTHQIGAAVLLVMLLPLLLPIAWLIWRADGSPVLFGHFRVGRDGRLFKCLKFRTMRLDADRVLNDLLQNNPALREEWLRDQKLRRDPRVTKIGEFLRRTSLDELPQLLNVLRGEMSLVGPRPITMSELAKYGASRWHYLNVRPGMTGLWQVSGRNNTTYEERVALDRHYVEHRSIALDVKILLRTVYVVLRRDGAH
jgi:lipopolysaccharide/colanic/teichoic acid biosynthesis glycosyltransferase